jgi:hypothetical protein
MFSSCILKREGGIEEAGERERERESSDLFIHFKGPSHMGYTFLTSFESYYLPKAPSLIPSYLGVRALVSGFGEDTNGP